MKYNAKWGGQMVEMNFKIGYGNDEVDFFILRDVRRTPSL
ncbi:DUF6783 domain-containing protein [Eisenbergiella tayi]